MANSSFGCILGFFYYASQEHSPFESKQKDSPTSVTILISETMGIWVVAVAAAAGYIAKRCKNLLNRKRDSQVGDVCHRIDERDELPAAELPFSYATARNELPFSYATAAELPFSFSYATARNELPAAELPFSYVTARKKSNLRSRIKLGHPIKPLNSLESCCMALIYKERDEVEDYIFSSNSAHTVRPFEAELVAELERFELAEFDQDFVPDLAEGELRLEPFRTQAGGQPYADEDSTATWTPQPVDYAVSPRELSIRLHEVLQSQLEDRVSQLEDRVNELETALQKSESKVRYMVAELLSSWRDSSESSSAHRAADLHATYQPVQMNLSGEAYQEAYNMFMRLNESKEKDFSFLTSGVEEYEDDR